MLCDSTGVSLWTIPLLYPCSSRLANQVQDIEPYYCCETGKTPGPNETYEFDTLSDWYHGMDQPFILDITISVDASTAVELNRHLLEFPLVSNDHPPEEPPIKVHRRIQVVFQEDEGYLEDCRISDGHVVLYWSAKSGLNIQTAPLDAAGESKVHSASVVYETQVVDRYQSSLCSASGRMCRVLGPDMLEIIDFLEPPWAYS